MRAMNSLDELVTRAGGACELCADGTDLAPVDVSQAPGAGAETALLACANCRAQLAETSDVNHWRCLTTSMWSEVPAVQVLAFRTHSSLATDAPWAAELLEQLYLEDNVRAWAEAGLTSTQAEPAAVHRDSNGAILETGDTVTLIKDLDVKGANFVAKRGTAVRGIALVADNPEHIEGRVNGTRIVILTQYVRKQK